MSSTGSTTIAMLYLRGVLDAFDGYGWTLLTADTFSRRGMRCTRRSGIGRIEEIRFRRQPIPGLPCHPGAAGDNDLCAGRTS